MSTDLIRYDLLVQNALKGVVRNVLIDAARDGLPGEHHFCITFRTQAPGVKLSARVKERYPEELTIILQHQFWDLTVTDAMFEVGLSFGRIPERLTVPFDAVTGFWDPSVQFGLKFEIHDDTHEAGANDAAPTALHPKTATPVAAAPLRLAEPQAAPAEHAAPPPPPPPVEMKPPVETKPFVAKEKAGEPTPPSTEGKVVSIDSFRKKP